MQLSKSALQAMNSAGKKLPAALFTMPEKVLQFGTGVLLRGLPDYYIDKANKQGIFNGRVVMVKSTEGGDISGFQLQDNVYTHSIRGVKENKLVQEYVYNTAISRILSAKSEWEQVLACATNPDMEIIISNTTEVGIVLVEEDRIGQEPPVSFPGKLLDFLHHRFLHFKGDVQKGMVIIPTELISDNGTRLQSIVMELAHLNQCDYAFMDWLENANHFCNSLVDRIVPGSLNNAQQKELTDITGVTDDLAIMSEPYGLWAIESAEPEVAHKLSFADADEGIIITADINKFRELKLRLLNGTHTFTCGLAFLAGFETVRAAMEDKVLRRYAEDLLSQEMVPCIVSSVISLSEARAFARTVIDRFSNPFIEHKWISITLNYTYKMKARNIPLILEHYRRHMTVPELMAMGFAAYLLFMKCAAGESGNYFGKMKATVYPIQDDHAMYFHRLWQQEKDLQSLAGTVLSDKELWGENLSVLPGFRFAVANYLELFTRNGIGKTIQSFLVNRNILES